MTGCAVNLAQRRRGGGLVLEFGEALPPVRAQFGAHAALDEGPTHGRCVGLKLGQFGGVFRRQQVGHRGQDLGGLHDRPLQAAEDLLEVAGIAVEARVAAEQPVAGDPRRQAADRGADPCITANPATEGAFLTPPLFRHPRGSFQARPRAVWQQPLTRGSPVRR